MSGELLEDDDRADYATYCPDCDAQFYEDEEGFDWEQCIECGSSNVYEVPA